MAMVKSILLALLIANPNFPSYNYNKEMDISNCITKTIPEIDQFISKNFEKLPAKYINPVFPYNVRYKNKSDLTFCDLRVSDIWVFREKQFVTFFIILPNDLPVLEAMTKRLGSHEAETGVSINDSGYSTAFYWTINHYSATLRIYRNIWGIKKYDNCLGVRFGNAPLSVLDEYNQSLEFE